MYGNHVLAIPYKNQLLLLKTKCVALSFQVRLKKENKVYKQERTFEEETGGIPETIDYIAQYQVHTFDNSIFKKDVYIVKVKSFEEKSDYLKREVVII